MTGYVVYFFVTSNVAAAGARSFAISASFSEIGLSNIGISTALRPCSPLRKRKMYVSFAGRYLLKNWKFFDTISDRSFSTGDDESALGVFPFSPGHARGG